MGRYNVDAKYLLCLAAFFACFASPLTTPHHPETKTEPLCTFGVCFLNRNTAALHHDTNIHVYLGTNHNSIINYETVKYFTNESFEVARVKQSVQEYQRFSVSTQASLSILNVSQQFIMYFTLTLGT